ncbi:pleiotropic ABC efflux transporter of multiple drugs [Monosporozyma servazzii]
MSLASNNKEAGYIGDPNSSSSASTTSSQHSIQHPYTGLDEQEIRSLARSLTRQSFNAGSNNNNNNNSNDIESHADTQSIFSKDLPGVNPVYATPDAEGYDPRLDPASEKFSSKAWVQNMANLVSTDVDFYKPYSLGCTWKNLSATGESADVTYQSTFANLPIKIVSGLYRKVSPLNKTPKFQILKPMDGCLNPGELLVVLGRPGSGCTTLLKSISSNTHGFDISKDSTIWYNGLTPKEIRKHYRGEVVYNAESDIHLPHLTVYQTLFTVARLKTPQNRIKGVSREDWAHHATQVTMATYGLSHTKNTKVGNDLVRGVSGGERKRVSIAEVSICGSKFQCWDNATRGLDSATALEFVRALKTQAEIANSTATVAIYQCSQDAYDLFDKVCVLDGGYQIFYGSTKEAKQYFIDMGYICPERETTADFLTSITSPAERIINPDYAKKGIRIPQNAKEMNEYWIKSKAYKKLLAEIDENLSKNEDQEKEIVKQAHIAKQSNRARPSSPYVVSYGLQIKYILIRNWWRIKQSSSVTLFQVGGNSAMAFILGSMFYKVMLHTNTSTFYFRGAAMFFAILFNAFSCLLEIFSLYEARPITEKHRTYSLYHPSADAFASVISEAPAKFVTAIFFNIVFYFLVNFRRNGGVFFFYFLINIVATFGMSHLFRCVGSLTKTLQEAMVPASMLLLAMSMFTGFAIPKTKILGWSKWIWYINPLAYLFESLMVNEFHDVKYPCTEYIPMGPAYVNSTGTQRVCGVVGSVPGQDYVLGDDYIKESYDYEHKHKWRGFGIGLAYVIFFFFVYLILCEYNEGAKQKGEMLIFPQSVVRRMKKEGKLMDKNAKDPNDIESFAGNEDSSITDKSLIKDSAPSSSEEAYDPTGKETIQNTNTTDGAALERTTTTQTAQSTVDEENLLRSIKSRHEELERNIDKFKISESVATFHWRDVCYDINIKNETRRILSNVDGWVKPGTLTALMGASGAGKTTLLDCLAERTTMGVITGKIFVDGRLRDTSFPRSIGYCQQQDLHLKTATVRESLRFSAYLRQPADVSKEDKNAYVEEVIKILEMEPYAEAVVGEAGEGLNVEQRKRLTIGVELAAKPKLLVFLDEPTSGLDSQTAWATCQLMKKLTNHGQAILCTIHQPSAILMQEFDRLLFLQKGGQTVYFGDLGDGCKTMIKYFENHGAQKCPPDDNPAEWMLQVVGAAPGSVALQDYHEVWRNSEEYKAVQEELVWMEKELPNRTEEASEEAKKQFATTLLYQCGLVSHRLVQQYWRSPSYLWSKFILTIFNQLFIGFTFFKADRSMQGLQNQMLSIFMYTVIFNPILQQYLPSFVQQRDLYEARERPSRTFSWIAFIVSQILVEIPWNFMAATLAYCIYYYAVGFYNNASVAGQLHERGALFWLFSTAFYVYIGSMGILTITWNEVAENAAHFANLMFTMCLSFCGVMVTKEGLPRFWIFMYRVSPVTYLIDAMLSVGVANVKVECSHYEFVQFTPPEGMNCGQYMAPYIKMAGTGYLSDPNKTDLCQFCPYSETNVFLQRFSSSYSRRWRNYGIFCAYIVFNYCAGVFLYWLARVPKHSGKMAEKS